MPKIKALKGARSRARWITREEADALIAALPKHLATMAEFSLETGLRRANVTHLEWSQVDLARKTAWVPGDKTKNRKALAVPLSDKAVAILEAQSGKHPMWVFVKEGKPVVNGGESSTRVAKGCGEGSDSGFLLLARPASHLGKLACPERYAPERSAGTRRVVVVQDGAALRPPVQRAPSVVGRPPDASTCGE